MGETRNQEPVRGLPRVKLEQQQAKKSKKIARRELFRRVGALAVLSVAGIAAGEGQKHTYTLHEAKPAPPKPIASEPTVDIVNPPLPESPEVVKKNKLNQILALRLGDPSRQILEKDYANWSTSLDEVDLGLLAVVNSDSRIALLEKRYNLRKTETPNHKPLTQDQLEWAAAEGIHAETLGIALEAREIAIRILPEILKNKGIEAQRRELEERIARGELPKRVLETFENDPRFAGAIRIKGIESFRPDIADKVKKGDLSNEVLDNLANNPELMLLSAGGMARLIITESGITKAQSFMEKVRDRFLGGIRYGFANIGRKPAVEMTVDTRAFPKKPNDEAINFLAQILSEKTGLQFMAENIPGSERDANSMTGGALGIQIMPARAKDMYINLQQYFGSGDPLPHPLDPKGSAVLAYIFLAQGAVNKDGYQPGYVRGPVMEKSRDISQAFNTEAIKTWNPEPRQAYEIIVSDQSFLKRVTTQRVVLPAAA